MYQTFGDDGFVFPEQILTIFVLYRMNIYLYAQNRPRDQWWPVLARNFGLEALQSDGVVVFPAHV